jgi:hypothetical protein
MANLTQLEYVEQQFDNINIVKLKVKELNDLKLYYQNIISRKLNLIENKTLTYNELKATHDSIENKINNQNSLIENINNISTTITDKINLLSNNEYEFKLEGDFNKFYPIWFKFNSTTDFNIVEIFRTQDMDKKDLEDIIPIEDIPSAYVRFEGNNHINSNEFNTVYITAYEELDPENNNSICIKRPSGKLYCSLQDNIEGYRVGSHCSVYLRGNLTYKIKSNDSSVIQFIKDNKHLYGKDLLDITLDGTPVRLTSNNITTAKYSVNCGESFKERYDILKNKINTTALVVGGWDNNTIINTQMFKLFIPTGETNLSLSGLTNTNSHDATCNGLLDRGFSVSNNTSNTYLVSLMVNKISYDTNRINTNLPNRFYSCSVSNGIKDNSLVLGGLESLTNIFSSSISVTTSTLVNTLQPNDLDENKFGVQKGVNFINDVAMYVGGGQFNNNFIVYLNKNKHFIISNRIKQEGYGTLSQNQSMGASLSTGDRDIVAFLYGLSVDPNVTTGGSIFINGTSYPHNTTIKFLSNVEKSLVSYKVNTISSATLDNFRHDTGDADTGKGDYGMVIGGLENGATFLSSIKKFIPTTGVQTISSRNLSKSIRNVAATSNAYI